MSLPTAEEIETLTKKPPLEEEELRVPYRSAIEKAIGLVKSPYAVWESLNVHEKQRLFYFLFEGKLAYSKFDGYRNSKNLCTVRMFEEFATANPRHVEIVLSD